MAFRRPYQRDILGDGIIYGLDFSVSSVHRIVHGQMHNRTACAMCVPINSDDHEAVVWDTHTGT